MIDLLALCAFNAAYAHAIDSDALERWPDFFTEDCHYRITHVENESEGLPAGIVYADSRAMLEDRIAALREANIYERQSYRHILGLPYVVSSDTYEAVCETPFMVARIVQGDDTSLFATGIYKDVFELGGERMLLKRRIVVCDSSRIDTLLAIPL